MIDEAQQWTVHTVVWIMKDIGTIQAKLQVVNIMPH